MKFNYNDGGRAAAGYKGTTGDCVCRAIAITTGRPYQEVYDLLAAGNATQRKSKHTPKRGRTAASGINVGRKWFKEFMASLGFQWVPTMLIGQGCKVHLTDGELPNGKLVVSISKHYTAVIDQVIHDTYNPERENHCSTPYNGMEFLKPGQFVNEGNNMVCWVERRCVYGYFILKNNQL